MNGRFLRVKDKDKLLGYCKVNVSFLDQHLSPDLAKAWQQALQRYANGYDRPTSVYWVLRVLRLWFGLSKRQRDRYQYPPVSPDRASSLIKDLRRAHYEAGAEKHKAFPTINGEWGCFIQFMRRAERAQLFPSLRWDSSAYGPISYQKIRPSRDTARTLNELSLVPKSMDKGLDSYNAELLEPISLSLSDEEYLIDYERRLGVALDSFHQCAVRDFESLKTKYEEGLKLVAGSKYSEIMHLLGTRRDRDGKIRVNGGYIDPTNGKHFFRESDGHPDLLANLLSVVHHEMGDIPTPYQSSKGGGGERLMGPPHWVYVTYYGKNRLIPYMGLLTADSAITLIVLILLEHPNINVESLMRAEISGRDGRTIVLNDAGENGGALRLTVNKPRARSQKHAILSPLVHEVVAHVLKWTAPARKQLRKDGRVAESRRLWIGIELNTYDLTAFTPLGLRRSFRPDSTRWRKSDSAYSTRTSHFLQRHPELKPWAEKATLRSLRVSKGVLRWLRGGGDAVAAASVFGHRQVSTTLTCYVPKALQAVMYERHVRRHQNLLIAAASATRPYLLQATDFGSTSELHHFLASLLKQSGHENHSEEDTLLGRVRSILEPPATPTQNNNSAESIGRQRVLIYNDPERLAVAFLYREFLLNAPTRILDTPDVATRTTPRMWLDIASALQGELPDAMHELRELVGNAQCEADRLRGRIHFPAYVERYE